MNELNNLLLRLSLIRAELGEAKRAAYVATEAECRVQAEFHEVETAVRLQIVRMTGGTVPGEAPRPTALQAAT